MKVIDLSQFNVVEDWDKVKKTVSAVILRLGYRGAHTGAITYDPKYQEYMAACQKLDIPAMIYFFPCSISAQEAETEAKFIISAAQKVKLCGPIWLDSEAVYADKSGRSDKLSKADRTLYLNTILQALKAAGYECGVYASASWFAGNLNDGMLMDGCKRWVAQWADACTYNAHTVDMWQYTSDGQVSGIKGRVDISECYIDLNVETGAAEGTKETGTSPQAKAVTRQDIVEQICSWEGWDEKNGKYKRIIDIYNGYLPDAIKSGTLNYTVKYSDEWCATAASAAYIQAGAPELFPIECGCPRMVTLAKKMGIWQEADSYIPAPADAILYDWQDSGTGDNAGVPDHIGIVIAVDEKAGTFTVMEGNKDESVARRTMKINGRYIRGFICPNFDPEPEPGKAKSEKAEGGQKAGQAAEKKAEEGNEQKKEEVVSVAKYEKSGTGTPLKKAFKTGLLKNNQKVTARKFPDASAAPCSFSPVQPLTRIDVCDTITGTDGKKWHYCCVNGKYGYILYSSIRDYLRTGGASVEQAAKWVIADDFATGTTRKDALKALGYDAEAVQDKVNELLGYRPSATAANRIRIAALAFFDTGDESAQFGDCTALIEYGDDDKTIEHAVLIDTAKANSAANVVKKLKALGVQRLDAIIISHGHGDHYGGVSDIMKAFPVSDIYVPDCAELDKYQKSYGNALRRQYAKASGHYMKAGTSFSIGSMHFTCIYQCRAADLTEHDSHHFVNNQSAVLRVDCNGWIFHTAGDLQNEGNNLLIKAVKDLKADIMKCQWHGDANACNEAVCKAVKPLVAFSNYHHKEQSGRGTTRKRLEAVGATVARNHENGDIYIDCMPGKMELSCSKKNISKTWTKAVTDQTTADAAQAEGTISAASTKWSSYKVALSTKQEPEDVTEGMLLAIEPEDYTAAEVAALKAKGAAVLGYLNLGSVETGRSYYESLKPYAMDQLEDWPDEYYLDVRKAEVRNWALSRAKEIKAQGFDGFWIDNLDVYEEYESSDMFTAISLALAGIKGVGGYVMVNGGMAYLQKAFDMDSDHRGLGSIDGVTQEEVFSKITDYGDGKKDKGKFGTQTSKQSTEYQDHLKRVIRHKEQAFLLEYVEDTDNTTKLRISAYCKATGAMACISDDVNL